MSWSGILRSLFACTALFAMGPAEATATEWFVAIGGTGPGTASAPFGRIQDALNVAQAGDTVTVAAGTFAESLQTVRNGTASLPIRLRAQGSRGTTVVTFAGRVLRANHAYVTVENLVLDGQFGVSDTVSVASTANFLTLRNLEVRRSTVDLIDIRAPQGVLIENSLIHHALNAANGRTDAHGIVAGSARDLTIRNTEIHTFSGDGFQIDPGRAAPGWDRVTIEGSRIWLAPLPAPVNGFAAGIVPGENAVDTKVGATLPRANITIRDTVAWGFRSGLIGNMAAFNLKENINAVVDRVTVYDSEIAFRLRGGGSAPTGAWVTVQNAVIYGVSKAFRYEDNIQNLKLWNITLGRNVTSAFQAASSGSGGLEVRNVLVLGASLPTEAAHASNRWTGAESFVDAANNNYALAPGATPIDAGVTLPSVKTDRAGTARPQGAAYDIGAFEGLQSAAGVSGGDVIVHLARQPVIFAGWQVVPDATAASGLRIWQPEQGVRVKNIQWHPTYYFEVTAWVETGKSYRIWLRGRAAANSPDSDGVYVQFSNSTDEAGNPIYRIGEASAAKVALQECSTCLLSGWGWQDHGTGLNALGPAIKFATTGLQTIRIQTWEDGFSLDQLVLSPSKYLSTPPGPASNDATILPES